MMLGWLFFWRRKTMAVTGLKIERIKNELTQSTLANLAKIPQHRLSELERGVHPKPDELERLARTLGVPPENLIKVEKPCR
jgi:transcriptional regulator with XRE-family HTH domain